MPSLSSLLTLGPSGTFSHEAALSLYPKSKILFSPNFDALFTTLQKNGDIGLVPLENSLHGPVDEVLDLLRHTDVKIWKTEDILVRHAFGAVDPSAIRKVASHPQALAQCRAYLRAHYPDIEPFPISSTASGVDLALKDPTVAAIASAKLMRERGLPVIQDNIQKDGNTTRFGIVAKEDPFPDSAKTQMGVALHPREDRPGLLHELLTPFKIYDVNLTRIESRPTGDKLGDYVFFVDFLGDRSSARVQKTLGEIGKIAEIKILGEW